MDSLLSRLKNIALSDRQLLELVHGHANIVLYPELWKINRIDEILDPYGAAIIFFESDMRNGSRFGHWCLLFELPDGSLEFFNPYGGYPDDSLKYIPQEIKQSTHQDKPYLSILLLKSSRQLTYNEHKFQHDGDSIMTCGRHVACRLNNRDLSLEDYHRMLVYGLDQLRKKLCKNKTLNFDDMVSILTS
jgi:hypothetical protein